MTVQYQQQQQQQQPTCCAQPYLRSPTAASIQSGNTLTADGLLPSAPLCLFVHPVHLQCTACDDFPFFNPTTPARYREAIGRWLVALLAGLDHMGASLAA
jgi:hypothetical protein